MKRTLVFVGALLISSFLSGCQKESAGYIPPDPHVVEYPMKEFGVYFRSGGSGYFLEVTSFAESDYDKIGVSVQKVSVQVDPKRGGTFFIATIVDRFRYVGTASEMTIIVRNEELKNRWEKFLLSYTIPQDVAPSGR